MREPLKKTWGSLGEKEKEKESKNQRIAAPGFLFNEKTLKNRQLS
jgi:hypothetical protein